MPVGNLAVSEIRRENRDEVHHRTRAVHADGRPLPMLVVNTSPHGFMARCEAPIAEGDRLEITLPGIGRVGAQVRWSLGGRIGCKLDQPIEVPLYDALLAILQR